MNQKHNPIYLIISFACVILFFVALWLGCWLVHITQGTWAEFPSFATSFLCCIGCIIGAMGGACGYKDGEL